MSGIVRIPDYYERFACLGETCHYNCCQGWLVTLTKQDYMRIRKLKKSDNLQHKMDSGLKRFKKDPTDRCYAQIAQHGELQLCPILNDAGLCSLQLECGYKSLPDICKTFPRITHEIPAAYLSCSCGCEQVVSLLMDSPDGLFYHTRAAEKGEFSLEYSLHSAIVKHTRPVFDHYHDVRSLCIGILQNRAYSLDNRMILLGIALKDLNELDQTKPENAIPNWLIQTEPLTRNADLKDSLNQLPGDSIFCLLNNIQNSIRINKKSNLKFAAMYEEISRTFHITLVDGHLSVNSKEYLDAAARFPWSTYEPLFENIIVNDFFTYNYPFTNDTIWESYMFFCYVYSLLKFMVIGYMTPEKTKNDLIQVIVACSRCIFNSVGSAHVKNFTLNNSDTLAHMAIIIKG